MKERDETKKKREIGKQIDKRTQRRPERGIAETIERERSRASIEDNRKVNTTSFNKVAVKVCSLLALVSIETVVLSFVDRIFAPLTTDGNHLEAVRVQQARQDAVTVGMAAQSTQFRSRSPKGGKSPTA